MTPDYSHIVITLPVIPRGDCANGDARDALLYRLEPTDPESPLVCAECRRAEAFRTRARVQLCDNGDGRPAWRNPKTRRDEYLCGACHVASGDGVVLNKWAPRVSIPLAYHKKAVCAAANVPGTKPCNGNVKPRGATGVNLCNQHAGKPHPG